MGYSINTVDNLAARLGFEPRYTAPEAAVLPLDDLAKWSLQNSLKNVINQTENTGNQLNNTGDEI